MTRTQIAQLAFLPLVLILSACTKDNTPPPTPLSTIIPADIQVKTLWSSKPTVGTDGQYFKLGSALYNNMLVSSGYHGKVVMMNPSNGKVLWQTRLSGHTSAIPALNADDIFIGTTDGTLYALSTQTGQIQWQVALPSIILGAPAAVSDAVVIQAHNSTVEAFASDTGKMLWSSDNTSPNLSLYGNSSPLIYNGSVYVGFDNGQMGAYDLYQGTETWQIPVAIPSSPDMVNNLVDLDGTPVQDNGAIFATSYHGSVTAINAPDGHLIWQKKRSSFEAPAVANNKIFITTETGTVDALDESTGQVLWQQKAFQYRFVSAPAILNNTVIVGDYAGYVHFLAMNDGHELARINVSSEGIRAAPIVYNSNILIVTSNDGRITALQIKGQQ
ncbi:MAG: outer membrane protein assembly factor BamB [Gammaproteobacteria bacterium]|nr:outer membrane protein assembly factor BamB [Gammaproteobacteria bacterium]